MNTTTRREVKAWGRAFSLLVVIVATGALIVAAGLTTIHQSF